MAKKSAKGSVRSKKRAPPPAKRRNDPVGAKKAAPRPRSVSEAAADRGDKVMAKDTSDVQAGKTAGAVQHPADQKTNDELEKMVRDPVIYNGETVSYVKDIGTSDEGFDANVKKVMIQRPGGGTEVVNESDIMRTVQPAGQEGRAYDRPQDSPKPLTENPEVK